jgi:twitching motility protein PilJ
MVEKRNTSVIGSTLKKPKVATLTVILIALVCGFAANFYLSQMNSKATNSYIQLTSDLKVLAQQTAKNAAIAANGQLAVFPSLAEGKDQFKSKLGQLKNGRPVEALPASPSVAMGELAKLTKLWGETSSQIDIV